MILNDFIKKMTEPKICVVSFEWGNQGEATITAHSAYKIIENSVTNGKKYVSIKLPADKKYYRYTKSQSSSTYGNTTTTLNISVCKGGDTIVVNSYSTSNSGFIIIEELI